MEMDDAAAVARVREGDREAFRTLVERHGRSLFRLGYRMTGNEQDAEEVVQETFMRAYRRIGEFESRSSFATWIYRIASNYALDLIARRKPQESLTPDPEDPQEVQLPSSDPGPDRLLYASEMQQKIAQAMADLSPAERTAFVLRHFEEKSIEEIAKVLNLRTGAAKNSVFRAVQKLRRALAPAVRPI
jgi:RNA polymerase sigma-70 factor (ECF subfamily)